MFAEIGADRDEIGEIIAGLASQRIYNDRAGCDPRDRLDRRQSAFGQHGVLAQEDPAYVHISLRSTVRNCGPVRARPRPPAMPRERMSRDSVRRAEMARRFPA